MSADHSAVRVAPSCPRWTDDELALAVREAYLAGYVQALALAAERSDELDAVWVPVDRPSREQRIAERTALFEACAAEMTGRLDAIRQQLRSRAPAAAAESRR